MKHLILITALFAPLPAAAQVEPPETLLDRLEQLAKPLLPLLRDLGDQIEKMPGYYPPEVLPNGDIIIRKKPEPDAPDTPEAAPKQLEPLEL